MTYSINHKFSIFRISMIIVPMLIASMLFVGCAGAPVGWGGTYEVISESERSITIRYDNITESFRDIFSVARTHCEKFGKDAIPSEKVSADAGGAIRVHYFKCE